MPPYFNIYNVILKQEPACDLRQHYMHPPLVKRVYAECSSLIQLIKLINTLKQDENDTIFRKITEKTHSYSGFTFNVTRCFLNTYDAIVEKKIALSVDYNKINNTATLCCYT